MDIKEIKEKVHSACKQISDTEPGIWRTSEWNICSHLQSILNKVFSEYNVDVELIKQDGRRPDIVIHKRGNNSNNLIVFQVKKNPKTKDLQDDLNKIYETFFSDLYHYKFGVLISVGKLPDILPDFDTARIGVIEVYGLVLDESNPENDNILPL